MGIISTFLIGGAILVANIAISKGDTVPEKIENLKKQNENFKKQSNKK